MMKIRQLYCSGYSEAIMTRVGSVKQQYKEAVVGMYMQVIIVVHFLRFVVMYRK